MMTPDEATAIRHALLHETNPTHLTGFASALAPEEAVAASLLFARAQVLERRREFGQALTKHLLDAVNQIASSPPLDATAGFSGVPTEAHDLLEAAGNLIARPREETMSALPRPVQAVLNGLLIDLVPGLRPPFLVLRPATQALLHSDPSRTSPEQRVERARWVRQYIHEDSALSAER